MKKTLPYIAIIIVLIYALYNAKFRDLKKIDTHTNIHYKEHIETHKTTHYEDELSQINTDEYTKQYIIRVINHGSNILDFKGGVMEAGFASVDDAEKIACYTLELSGKKCKDSYEKNAAMFYTSICGGCHGDDGKGLGGTCPNLTKSKLLGIVKRENFLKDMIQRSQ